MGTPVVHPSHFGSRDGRRDRWTSSTRPARRGRRRAAAPRADRPRGVGRRGHARGRPGPVGRADDRLPRARRPGDDPDLRRARSARRGQRDRRRRAAARARAISTSATPAPATRPRRPTPSRLACCATRCWRPTRCSPSGASRCRTSRRRRVGVDRSVDLQVRLPAHRLMPVALVAPEKHITVAAVCGARTLAEGRPPMGIACAQQDVARVYPLPDDPERCLEDFAALRGRARPPHGRAPRPPGGVGAPLPGAPRRGLPLTAERAVTATPAG